MKQKDAPKLPLLQYEYGCRRPVRHCLSRKYTHTQRTETHPRTASRRTLLKTASPVHSHWTVHPPSRHRTTKVPTDKHLHPPSRRGTNLSAFWVYDAQLFFSLQTQKTCPAECSMLAAEHEDAKAPKTLVKRQQKPGGKKGDTDRGRGGRPTVHLVLSLAWFCSLCCTEEGR